MVVITQMFILKWCFGCCSLISAYWPMAVVRGLQKHLAIGLLVNTPTLRFQPNLIAWFVFRGGGTGGPCPSKDSWKFAANKKEWTKLPECSNPRMYTSMAMLPPLNGSERRAVLYAGQEKSISVLGVIKTVIVCVKKQVKLDCISNLSYPAISVRIIRGKMWPTRIRSNTLQVVQRAGKRAPANRPLVLTLTLHWLKSHEKFLNLSPQKLQSQNSLDSSILNCWNN